jgi:hypothetical protein
VQAATKQATLDALTRFPKALHDNVAFLNTALNQRLPKNPSVPRRSKRTTAVSEEAEDDDDAKCSTKEPSSSGHAQPAEWNDSLPQDIDDSVADGPSSPVGADEKTGPVKRKRRTNLRNVGGWVSPNFAAQLDRSWLDKDSPGKAFDPSTYAPQVGEAVLCVKKCGTDGS